MGQVTIKNFSTTENFKYLWLKYVTDVNLSVHCARCLIGLYSKQIDASVNNRDEIVLNEAIGKYFYLCGVTAPYRYHDNLHVAFRYAEGKTEHIEFNGTTFDLINAQSIPIVEMPVYRDINGNRRDYVTCRNWRFAYMVQHGLIDTIGNLKK